MKKKSLLFFCIISAILIVLFTLSSCLSLAAGAIAPKNNPSASEGADSSIQPTGSDGAENEAGDVNIEEDEIKNLINNLENDYRSYLLLR